MLIWSRGTALSLRKPNPQKTTVVITPVIYRTNRHIIKQNTLFSAVWNMSATTNPENSFLSCNKQNYNILDSTSNPWFTWAFKIRLIWKDLQKGEGSYNLAQTNQEATRDLHRSENKKWILCTKKQVHSGLGSGLKQTHTRLCSPAGWAHSHRGSSFAQKTDLQS